MATPGITVLKNNVPWGPFTRAQIEQGLNRGDFSIKNFAHAPGLNEWLPLGEVIDHVDGNVSHAHLLPPVPDQRDLPPIPETPAPPAARPVLIPDPPKANPPILPAPVQIIPEKIAPPTLPAAPPKEARLEVKLATASFFLRGIAFVIDCGFLFVPVLLLFSIGAAGLEISAWWSHVPQQTRSDEWTHLQQNTERLAFLVAVGFGWLYGAGFESSRSQATIGKRWMGVKVTDEQGERISFMRATGRYVAKYLSALPFFLGFIMAIFSSRRLALHDRLSGTRVVKR